ncbi:MAG: glycosyltransferase family 2 protein [Treponema sp.]|jgi:dolichol-phosphate mannosyltransferase|nr:glycosyltransferase family 2 protein [Treponema sp.]
MPVLVCVPTYNEAENIEQFINAVFEHCPSDADILVIDDTSPDGTADIVERLMAAYRERWTSGGSPRLHILKRPGKQGGASAFLQGFAWGIDNGYDAMLATDADFSHDPKYIPMLLENAGKSENNVVVGSRLVAGGGIENRTFTRNLISRGASLYCRLILTPGIKDWTGGFNLWPKDALIKIDFKNIVTRGYSFQIELKYKAFMAGFKITEVPIVFPDRKYGVSKMPASYFAKALFDVWRIKYMCMKTGVKQFVKFGITGGLGTITNLILFFILADKAALHEIPVSIGCFIAAGTQNYIINHKWSFANNTGTSKVTVKKWALFLISSLAGLLANIAVMTGIIMAFRLPYKFIAQACGIAAGMFINFFISRTTVFGRGKNADK